MQEEFDQSYNLQTLSVRDVSSACLCWMNTQSSTPAYFPSVRVKKERKKALRLLESHKKWLIKKIHNIYIGMYTSKSNEWKIFLRSPKRTVLIVSAKVINIIKSIFLQYQCPHDYLQCNYYNQGHPHKVDQSDYRTTIHSKTVCLS